MNFQGFGPGRPPRGFSGVGGAFDRPFGKERSLEEISQTIWLTPENAFFFEKNGLLYLKKEEKEIRITLARLFPFDSLWEFISVLNSEKEEVGLIRTISAFDDAQRGLLSTELERRYYAPVILEIDTVKERFGFSYWKVKTKDGKMQIVMQDTYKNMIRVNDKRVILVDADGNRFDIPDVSALDAKSFRKIELYL